MGVEEGTGGEQVRDIHLPIAPSIPHLIGYPLV